MNYDEFIRSKLSTSPAVGISRDVDINISLFPFQRDIVRWALRRGRAAIFAGTGLGKSRMQGETGKHVVHETGGDALILAPLAVAAQTVEECAAIDVPLRYASDAADVRPGMSITNYDRLHLFDMSRFACVMLDESSIIKHHDAKTLQTLMASCAKIPFRFCFTATPAPNDHTELGTHAEFLGVRTRVEMLSEFFCHDGGETQSWRLKGHARQPFWRWVSTWGALVRSPTDLGYSDDGHQLPPLAVHHHKVEANAADVRGAGLLFAEEASTLMERRRARRCSVDSRVARCAELVNAEANEPWIIWCDLNAESEALARAIPGSVEVRGSNTREEKEARLVAFARGEIRVLISKPSIAGFGLNWQHCARVAFVGVTDSWEAYYQAVRRCYRFGQRREVAVHIFASELEGAVIANLARKERDAAAMADALSAETRGMVQSAVRGIVRESDGYDPQLEMTVPQWLATEAA